VVGATDIKRPDVPPLALNKALDSIQDENGGDSAVCDRERITETATTKQISGLSWISSDDNNLLLAIICYLGRQQQTMPRNPSPSFSLD